MQGDKQKKPVGGDDMTGSVLGRSSIFQPFLGEL